MLGYSGAPHFIDELLEVPGLPLVGSQPTVGPGVAPGAARRVGLHQWLEHPPPLRAGIVGVGAIVRRRLLGVEAAEAGLDGANDAFLDYLGSQPVECPLERVAGVHVLAIDPGLAILPVDV